MENEKKGKLEITKRGLVVTGLLFTIALLIFLGVGIVLGFLFRKAPAGGGFPGAVDFPLTPFLGFRGTYLIALADPTTEMNFLPNISEFTPDSPCEPGEPCSGTLRYEETP
jgi:hypothetical protein